MKKISYKQVLVQLYEETDVQELNLSEIMLTRKIKQYDRDIGGIYSIQLNRTVKVVENNVLEFPADAFNIDFILLGDKSDENPYFIDSTEHLVTLNVSESIDTGNEIVYKLWADISYPVNTPKLNFVISNGKIQIDPYYEGETVTVFYGSYPKNQNGDFLINEEHKEAIAAALKLFIFKRQMYTRKMRGFRLNTDDYAFFKGT